MKHFFQVEWFSQFKERNIEVYFIHNTFSFFSFVEYLAAAGLREACLKHGGAQELLSENEICDFLKRTNVKNFVVRFWR